MKAAEPRRRLWLVTVCGAIWLIGAVVIFVALGVGLAVGAPRLAPAIVLPLVLVGWLASTLWVSLRERRRSI